MLRRVFGPAKAGQIGKTGWFIDQLHAGLNPVERLIFQDRRFEQRLGAVAASYPDPDSVRRQYLQSREAMAQLESAVLEDQALDWVQSHVQVVDKQVSFAALTGFGGPKDPS